MATPSDLTPDLTPDLNALMALIPEVSTALESGSELSAITALRAQGHDPEVVRAAVEQVVLRRHLNQHWPIGWVLTRDGVEQASHPLVADFHAEVVQKAGVTSIVDLTAGLGSDSAALARHGMSVTAVERDPYTAELLAHNVGQGSGVPVTILIGDSMELVPPSGAYFVDPARRSGTRTASGSRALPERDPERWSPPLAWVLDLATQALVFMKAAPALDPPPGWARYYISVDRTLVEVFTTNAHSGTFAVMISTRRGTTRVMSDLSLASAAPASCAPAAQVVLDYLYELDPAITRAGIVAQVARDLGAEVIGHGGIWLTGNQPCSEEYQRSYRVHAVFPPKEIAQHVAHLPGVAIKTKDSRRDMAALRKESKKPDNNHWAVVITEINGQETAVLVSRAAAEE